MELRAGRPLALVPWGRRRSSQDSWSPEGVPIFLEKDGNPPSAEMDVPGDSGVAGDCGKAVTIPRVNQASRRAAHSPRAWEQAHSRPTQPHPTSKTHSALSVMGLREFILPILEPTIRRNMREFYGVYCISLILVLFPEMLRISITLTAFHEAAAAGWQSRFPHRK